MHKVTIVTKITKLKLLILFYFQENYASINGVIYAPNYKSKNYTTWRNMYNVTYRMSH